MTVGMRRRRRFQAEAALQFALGFLAAPHRFRNQLVGEDEPGFGDVFHRQQHIGLVIGLDVIAMQPHGAALDAGERSAEALSPLVGDRHLDLSPDGR